MTVFYLLLAVDLPSWVLGIDDRSLSCCVQSLLEMMTAAAQQICRVEAERLKSPCSKLGLPLCEDI